MGWSAQTTTPRAKKRAEKNLSARFVFDSYQRLLDKR